MGKAFAVKSIRFTGNGPKCSPVVITITGKIFTVTEDGAFKSALNGHTLSRHFIGIWLFLWKPGLSLDRIDPNGHYNRQNCHWIPFKRQQRNRRNNRIVTIDGITGCLAEVCEQLGVPYNLMCNHLQVGKRSLQEIADFLRLPREERERIRVQKIFAKPRMHGKTLSTEHKRSISEGLKKAYAEGRRNSTSGQTRRRYRSP